MKRFEKRRMRRWMRLVRENSPERWMTQRVPR